MNLYESVWSYIIVYECIWRCIGLWARILMYMKEYAGIWIWMVVNESIWECVKFYDMCMDVYEPMWWYMKVYDYLRM